MGSSNRVFGLVSLLSVFSYLEAFPGEEKHDIGTLAGDVQNWATLIQNYIQQLANDGINRDVTQSYLDQANYTYEKINGEEIVKQVRVTLSDYFRKKKRAAMDLAEKVRELYDNSIRYKTAEHFKHLSDLSDDVYKDSDIYSTLPQDLKFNPYFKQNVSRGHSTVKISDEVPRDDPRTIHAVYYTAGLEDIFKKNRERDPMVSFVDKLRNGVTPCRHNLLESLAWAQAHGVLSLIHPLLYYKRWQYFGSTAGVIRTYPGREGSINFAGFYNDYDPRTRPWYIAATSGPKDVVIILDCSLSMKGEKFLIAKAVAKAVISTLTKQDYLNVICARASHWDEVGKWHYFDTEVLSCQEKRMVPATVAHRKDLIEQISKLKPGGTSELQEGFTRAFNILKSSPKTGCQSLIIFATDGKDTDGEQVRCGPGYYTRSGYVPGPICKYNWTRVWDVAKEKNAELEPHARIFSYLTKEDAEEFPGKLACKNNGSLRRLDTGENLISQMSNYFDFLASNARTQLGLWTSPYLDSFSLGLMVTYAIPVTSRTTGKTIGVVGIDATLDEIGSVLTSYMRGTVYSFLINDQGEAIFHPRLKPSTNLVDDPMFVPISDLEKDGNGNPAEFSMIEKEMREGKTGIVRVEISNVKGTPRTYYYAGLEGSEFSFAYSMADTDKEFRRSKEPADRTPYKTSYYNLLKEYNSSKVRDVLGDVFETLDVRYNEDKYPGLRITYNYSTIFLPPGAHCDSTRYIYDDDLAQKTINAHTWINSYEEDVGCEGGQLYDKGVRADVLITQPIEEIWKTRAFESLSQVKWTNVGLRSGVFRTYPGHRSTRGYDPTKRPWYKRTSANPERTSISTPYMDAAGVGKINTISQAVFEGMTPRTDAECNKIEGPKPGGCKCIENSDCIIAVCYLSKAPGPNRNHRRCATERVEAVTGLDILYDDFQNKTMGSMQASDFKKSCGQMYTCPDGEPECQTRCYLFDTSAYLVMDPDFLLASSLDSSKYSKVTLGRKEGEVMKDLIYKHEFLQRTESMDFQGTCSISPKAPKSGCLNRDKGTMTSIEVPHKVTLAGLPSNPAELDDYYKNRGPIPKFSNDFGCIQDVVGYKVNDSALGSSGMVTGNVSGPCMSGFYYVTALPRTNLYLLVIENWKSYRESLFYNFNCKIARSIVNSGAYRIINGTCAHEDTSSSTLAKQGRCPALRDLELKCKYLAGHMSLPPIWLIITSLIIPFWIFR